MAARRRKGLKGRVEGKRQAMEEQREHEGVDRLRGTGEVGCGREATVESLSRSVAGK